MKPFIFGERNGIYILDLKQTMLGADRAYTFLKETASKGGSILFVGTKKQAQEPIATQAERCGMPYINQRWLGGMLTNFVTIRSRIARMEELEAMVEDGRMSLLPKKEQAVLTKELAKLQANLGGARTLTSRPAAIFVVDTKREEIAIREANRLHIPVIGLLDTNSEIVADTSSTLNQNQKNLSGWPRPRLPPRPPRPLPPSSFVRHDISH